MTANTVEQWLSGVIGLDARTLGPQVVANAVKQRIAACGLKKESDYLEHLNTVHDELPSLIEMIVVPETWFFRDREPFVFLAQYVSTTWLAAHPHDQLQVLSVPCSSGEEPYSIAMTLQSVGLQPARYRIDAVDINPALLRKAEKGVYGPNSFRSGVLAHCEHYFKLEGTARIVSPEARAGIRFIHGNIMGPPGFTAEQTYDIIFCRNLLIYQHTEARQQIIATLDRLLKPAGLLFVGHAEMMSLLTDRYEPIRHSSAFAYCKINVRPKTTEPRPNQLTADVTDGHESEQAVSVKSLAELGQAVPSAVKSSLNQNTTNQITIQDQSGEPLIHPPALSSATRLEPASRLDCVRVLADQGRLDEAAAMCQDLLKENPSLAEAHFLLGLIRTAEGQIQAAEESLNRALYLDADFYEALIHLSLLKARRGDEAGAERLRRHAGRVRDHAKVTI
ncbi:MAG: tetratricopeptide repeat protein [Kiritimatiellaeota bacterium]|nr:tetratricopeptide repeat protein [Kiritimatiellota bacterium]